MIDFMTLPAADAERMAYSEGFVTAAKLFARIADLEAERDALQDELDDLQAELDDIPSEKERNQDATDLTELKEFFYECFNRLPGHYPCPSWSSDYDKSVIFEAIEKGEAT